MPKIQKENIWDLVSNEYHSCFITTYSFDLFYFEHNVMRILRSKGIGNITLFIDDTILQNILGTIDSNINSRIYSIVPILTDGCFHPKVYMFFGEKHGLLIVGSGNLTSSGHGKNDEVWGAFHFDINEKSNAQLFSNAWSFFQFLSSKIKGFSVEKFNWIIKFSPWIDTLPKPDQNTSQSLGSGNEVSFFSNDSSANIYEKLVASISDNQVREITIIAPYFDSNGTVVESLSSRFSSARINVLLDDLYGILPLKMKKNVSDRVNFYKWIDCFKNKEVNNSPARLHAKIFHFVLADKTQYCLFGSANASVAALGINNHAKNIEVSVLIKSSNQNFLDDLDINIYPRNKKLLSEFKPGIIDSGILNKNDAANNLFYIQAIDKEGFKLAVFINNKLSSNHRLVLFNSWGERVLIADLTEGEYYYSVKLSHESSEALYGCIIDSISSEIISNKQIIQDVLILTKTNPDPQKQILDVLFSGIEEGNEFLFSKLLDCLSDEDFEVEHSYSSSRSSKSKLANSDDKIGSLQFAKLAYDEFKNVSNAHIQHQYHLINSNSNRIADFLFNLTKQFSKEIIPSQETEDEEIDKDIQDNVGREDNPGSKHITKSAFNSERNRIKKFLERYTSYLNRRVTTLLVDKDQDYTNEEKVSLTELSNFVIALYIIIYYTERNRQYTSDDKVYHEKFITIKDNQYFDRLSVILSDIIGPFLLLCTKGFKSYESDYLNSRVNKLKSESFYNCLFSIALAHWKGKEVHHKRILLLNSLFYFPDNLSSQLNDSDFISRLNMLLKLNSSVNQYFISDCHNLVDMLLPRYKEFLNNKNLPQKDQKKVLSIFLNKNSTIFAENFGFCRVENRDDSWSTSNLTLSRPGFPWNESKEEYLLDQKVMYKHNIVF